MKDYILEMWKTIGHTPLLCIGCGVMILNEEGNILLQRRRDDNIWCVPGGGMNYGESFVETAAREVLEETGLMVEALSLFGIYSGKQCIIEYPNQDFCFGALIIFITSTFTGMLLENSEASREYAFFSRNSLPENLHPASAVYIEQWRAGKKPIIVD